MVLRLSKLFLGFSLLWLVNGNLEPEGIANYSYNFKLDAQFKSSRGLGALQEGFNTGICASGKRQSPIKIPEPIDPTDATLNLNKNYWKVHKSRVTNSFGHTLQGDIKGNPELTISGSLLNDQEYIFDSFHFHWGSETKGSEHVINETFIEASEMHLVHYNSKYDSKKKALASKDPSALAVIGITFEISEEDNPNLRCIISAARAVREPGAVAEKKGLNLTALIFQSEHYATFARYSGSLTTPTCDEVVLWNVKINPTSISKQQLRAFRTLNDDEGNLIRNNFRPLQDANGRQVTFFQVRANPPAQLKSKKKSNDEEDRNEKTNPPAPVKSEKKSDDEEDQNDKTNPPTPAKSKKKSNDEEDRNDEEDENEKEDTPAPVKSKKKSKDEESENMSFEDVLVRGVLGVLLG